MRTDPDRDLVLACQETRPSGFEGAFRELYDLYKDRVYNVCYRITGNPADALDASQETFGILFRKIGAFRFESRFSSWVYRIAVNASIDLKRRASVKRPRSLDSMQAALNKGVRRIPTDNMPIEELIKGGYILVGSADTVAERLAELEEELGFATLGTNLTVGSISENQARENIEAFAKEVMPRFRKAEPEKPEPTA